jgi:hypothetical protein
MRGGWYGSTNSSGLSSLTRSEVRSIYGKQGGFRIVSICNDRDRDGLIDSVETNTGTYVDNSDTGTDPDNPDTDGDGLLDSAETNTGIFVDVSDTGTSPHIFDTNNNGNSDGLDVDNNMNPVSPLNIGVPVEEFYESKPAEDLVVDATPLLGFPSNNAYQWYLNDLPIAEQAGGNDSRMVFYGKDDEEGRWTVVVSNAAGETEASFEYRVFVDSDLDGLSDYREQNFFSTLVDNRDSDGDGLSDGDEVLTHRTNPLSRDSDSDGFTDRYEIEVAYDPNSADSFPDSKVDIMTAIEVNFVTKIGVNYTIEFSTDSQTWNVIEHNIAGKGGVIERLYSRREYPAGFFRVRSDAE